MSSPAGFRDLPLPGNIHVWLVPTPDDHRMLNAYLQILSPSEMEKAARFRFEADRGRFIMGRAVLRKLSSQFLGCKTSEVRFGYKQFGKPFYENATLLKFNLSHSNNLVVIGFSSNLEIGIDVEKVRSDYDFSDIAQTVFNPNELLLLNKLAPAERLARFYELWTRKEAFIKGMGYGLSFPVNLKEISVLSEQVETGSSIGADIIRTMQSWRISSFDLSPSYRAAVAINGKIEGVTVSTWNNNIF